MLIDLVPIWTAILGLAVFYYVVFDGFDLGVGILSGLAPPEWRRLMMNSVAPVWDGNETWLVLGSTGLLAAFPLAFAIIIPAVYFPDRDHAAGAGVPRGRLRIPLRDGAPCRNSGAKPFVRARRWRRSPKASSSVHSSRVSRSRAATSLGTSFDFFTPFALLTGIALMFGYALLGSGWLVMKTEDELQAWSRRAGRICLIGVGIAVLAVSIWTPLVDPEIARRWFSWPNILWLSPVPIVTAAIAALCWHSLGGRSEALPFLSAIALFLMSFVGITISLWPMIVPRHYTLWQAASAPGTQAFLLIGTLFLLPVILMYTAWSYWVFRGKVRSDIGYH